jgi:hypothetical protein
MKLQYHTNRYSITFIFIMILVSNSCLARDYCQEVTEQLYEKDNDIIAVLKINTNNNKLHSSTIEVSKDCKKYSLLFTVKSPDVIQSINGLCMVLPAGELKANLCGLRNKICVSKVKCQSYDIKLESEHGRYIRAIPSYYEMSF